MLLFFRVYTYAAIVPVIAHCHSTSPLLTSAHPSRGHSGPVAIVVRRSACESLKRSAVTRVCVSTSRQSYGRTKLNLLRQIQVSHSLTNNGTPSDSTFGRKLAVRGLSHGAMYKFGVTVVILYAYTPHGSHYYIQGRSHCEKLLRTHGNRSSRY